MANADALRQTVRLRYARVHAEATRLLVNALREAAPLGATGDTRRGIKASPSVGVGSGFAATVVSNGKGGEFVETGTRAWDKRMPAGRGNVMVFLGGGRRVSTAAPNQRVATLSGGMVFTKTVHHPKVPARPWFRPTVEQWPDFLERALVQA